MAYRWRHTQECLFKICIQELSNVVPQAYGIWQLSKQCGNVIGTSITNMLSRFTTLHRIIGHQCLSKTFAARRFQHVQHQFPEYWSAERYQRDIIVPRINRSDASPITKDEWQRIRSDYIAKVPRINDKNVDGLIVTICRDQPNALTNALTYIEMMKDDKIELNLAISNVLLEILYYKSMREPLSDADRDLIREM